MNNYNRHSLVPVVLSGGLGSRLWPLSRSNFPKQFLSLDNIDQGLSLLQNTILRLTSLHNSHIPNNKFVPQPFLLVTGEEQRFLALDQLTKLNLSNFTFLLEPCGRNTAPALTLAALQATEDAKTNPNSNIDPILVICPADHAIRNDTLFLKALNDCVRVVSDDQKKMSIALIGIKPSSPATGYGYIKCESLEADRLFYSVNSFTEKPDEETAKDFLRQGNYFWNSGIFVLFASTWLKAIEKFRIDILTSTKKAWNMKRTDIFDNVTFIRPNSELFSKVPSESIDFAVIEKCPASEFSMKMINFDGDWSDLGSWESIWKNGIQDENNNVLNGDVITFNSNNLLVHSSSRLVSTFDLRDLIIIETPDAVLVANKGNSQQVKDIVTYLQKMGRDEADNHRKVFRPWGWYDCLEEGKNFKVKRIQVKAGASLSMQKHIHRAEHWIVIKGVAEVVNGSQTFNLEENQSTYIPMGQIHRLSNPGGSELEIIEVQSGEYLGEDDIIRLDDKYGRV